jgi:hypothetical protein
MALKNPLRRNVALAIDGGGIKGVMVARALMRLEEEMGRRLNAFVRLTAGTSTGAIIAATLARGLNASMIHDLYVELGPRIFRKTWRNLPLVENLVRYRYDSQPFADALRERLGDVTLGALHHARPDFNMVITATDVYANRTRFIKLYKQRFANWLLRDAVMASSVVPTVFPVFVHRYASPAMPPDPHEAWIPEPRCWVDGGVGSYSNPCYMAAYEIAFCLGGQGWRLDNTTLISIGTGYSPLREDWATRLRNFRRRPNRLFGPEWAYPLVDIFLQDANLQQLRLTQHFFVDAVIQRTGRPEAALDFRRFNLVFDEPIGMDDAGQIDRLDAYGERLGEMIIEDEREPFGVYTCGAPSHAFDAGRRGM